MRYEAIIFDFGNTLGDQENHLMIPKQLKDMIKTLYHKCYRLAILSNTHRYQDSHWLRKHLISNEILEYFEVVLGSAVCGIHKPDKRVFKQVLGILRTRPYHTLMVGDSSVADGGAKMLGMDYMQVHFAPNQGWDPNLLYKKIEPGVNNKQRKLTNVSDVYWTIKDKQFNCFIRHLSEALRAGDIVVIHRNGWYEVTKINRHLNKEDIVGNHKNEDVVTIDVKKISGDYF